MKIKFVYFDVGGVVVLDYSKTNKWQQMLSDIGINTPELEKKFNQIWNRYKNRVCIDYDVDNFLPHFRKELNLDIPANYSFLSDFVNRFEKNTKIWPLLKKIKAKFNIGLLTNMYPRMLNEIRNKSLLPDISWNSLIDSTQVKAQKPEKKIFEIAQKRAGVQPEEILFVENTKKHILGAQKAGWQTFLYEPGNVNISNSKLRESLKLNF